MRPLCHWFQGLRIIFEGASVEICWVSGDNSEIEMISDIGSESTPFHRMLVLAARCK